MYQKGLTSCFLLHHYGEFFKLTDFELAQQCEYTNATEMYT